MEQTLGHVTHAQNLEQVVAQHSDIESVWMPIEFSSKDLYENLPGVTNNWTLRSSLRARKALKLNANSTKLDALMIHTGTIGLFCSPWMRKIPTIVSLDATPSNIDKLGSGYSHKRDSAIEEQLKLLCTRAVYQSASHLVAWSGWAAESLVADYGMQREHISIIPPGVDIPFWKSNRKDWRPRKSGADGGSGFSKLKLLFVGGDFVRKGGDTLLEAFRDDLHKDFTLDIVTSKDTVIPVGSLEGVTFHRNINPNSSELKTLYHNADMFVLPTKADCLPMAIIEAMASGLPIISTHTGAIPEMVGENKNGNLIEAGDADALAKAVRNVGATSDRLARFSRESARIAAERYDGKKNHGTILAAMRILAAQSSGK